MAVELFMFGVLFCLLISITGGMEAGIVMHSINNTVLFTLTALSKGSVNFEPNQAAALQDALLTIVGDILFFLLIVKLWKIYRQCETI